MTRHNLNQHLDWFLGSSLTEPPQPAYAPPPTSSFPNPSSLPQEVESLELARIVEEVDNNVHSPARQPEFVRPTLPASVLNAQEGHDMARLQSGPKSSKKPQLLSERIPVALQSSTPISVRRPATSLKDQYNAQWETKSHSKKL